MEPDEPLRGILEVARGLAGVEGIPHRTHPGLVSLEHLVCAAGMSTEVAALLGEGVGTVSGTRGLELLARWLVRGVQDPKLGELTGDLRDLRSELLERVFGQDHAVHAFVEGLYNAQVTAAADEERVRPMAVFVFAGPPGVGKTYMSELCAARLKRPLRRFDMAAYSDHQAYTALIGFEPSYRGAKAGLLTGFVRQNPQAVLIFDEIEKAHLTTMQLFHQILDAGVLQDRFDEEDVAFRDTIIIFTTNAGRSVYDRPNNAGIAVANAAYHRRTVLSALANETNSADGRPAFPPSICSRLGQGYPILFNHLGVDELERIVEAEMKRTEALLERQYFKSFRHDPALAISLVLREGADTDARQLRSEAERFIKSELFKFCSLYETHRVEEVLEDVDTVAFVVESEELRRDESVGALFCRPDRPKILLAADSRFVERCRSHLPEIDWLGAGNAEEAIEQLAANDADMVLLDLWLTGKDRAVATPPTAKHLPGAAVESLAGLDHVPLSARALDIGRNLLKRVHERFPGMPVYLLSVGAGAPEDSQEEGSLTLRVDAKHRPQANRDIARLGRITDDELFLACVRAGGARGILSTQFGTESWTEKSRDGFVHSLLDTCAGLHRERAARNLSRQRKALDFETSCKMDRSEQVLTIRLRDLRLRRVLEARDVGRFLSDVERPDVHFDDVFGAAAAKKSLDFVVKWLRDPKRYTGLGLRPPKGILLTGPPGTGKTLLARAVAGESDCTFCQTSATNFVTIWQGSGPQNVRDLFDRARRYAPAIVFIDEIDAIGRQRMGGPGSRAQEDTLNAILTEMEGFGASEPSPVIVLAATNVAEQLDEALKRRFDRVITVDRPDRSERLAYLKRSFGQRKQSAVSETVLERIANQSARMTIALLERVVQEAGVMAAQAGQTVDDSLLEEAFEKIRMGEVRELPSPERLLRIARHEAGHAFVAWKGGNRVDQVTIVGRADAGGYMERKADEDRPFYVKAELEQLICETMAGRAAEIVCYGEENGLSTGVGSDLKDATKLALKMVREFGMGKDTGQIALEVFAGQNGALPFAEQIAQQVEAVISEQLREAVSLIEANRELFDTLVDELVERNRLSESELAKILD
jgi:ATP-dependent metalloprotease FtsH